MEKDSVNFFVRILFAFFISLIGIFLVRAEIRINEVELNPEGTDAGNEWIELYSLDSVELKEWKIESSNGRNMTFNASFQGFYILTGSRYLLTNEDNTLTLKDSSGNVIFLVSSLKDEADDARSWQYCSGTWIFTEATKGSENVCSNDEEQIEEEEEQAEEEQLENNKTEEDSERQTQKIQKRNKEESNEEVTLIQQDSEKEQLEIIILGESEDIKSKNNLLYESKISRIKEYTLFSFSLVCILIIILLLVDRRKNKIGIEE